MPIYSFFFGDKPKPIPTNPGYLEKIIEADSSKNEKSLNSLIMECFIKGYHNFIREYLNTHFIINGSKNRHHLLGDLTSLADTFEKVMIEHNLSENEQYLSAWIRSEVNVINSSNSM